MNDEIKVHVLDMGRKSLYMRYRDPFTGKQHTRSTGTSKRREAERIAAKWEAELQEGRYHAPSRTTWEEFRHRYTEEVLMSLAENTHIKRDGVFNAVERILKPQRLRDLTADRLSYFQRKLRESGLSENSIAGDLAHLASALNWAVKVGLLAKAPAIERPIRARQAKVMKGRAITTEEFERMLDKTPDVVGKLAAASWRHYLRGLWLSGLRRAESLELWWDADNKLCIDLTGKYPMLRIPAELEKGNRDRLLPITPDFAEFLLSTPEEERTGPVFQFVNRHGKPSTVRFWHAGNVVARIGKAAGVKVRTYKSGKVKYASAHDLRRSFGEKWSKEVMPPVLMQLMRHESIETTLKYYVGRNAESVAKTLWEGHRGNTSGNTSVLGVGTQEAEMSQLPSRKGL